MILWKKRIRKGFYEEGKPPSHNNYLIILVIVVIIFAAYLVLSQMEIVPEIWEIPAIESFSDVSNAISDMGDVLSNASETLDDIGRTI